MIARALNQKTLRHLGFADFLRLARATGCIGVEPRNDLGRPIFDGLAPEVAGALARAQGLRLLGLSEVYPFNDWSDDRARQIAALIDTAAAAGAETISLIPRVDGIGCADVQRQMQLRAAMREILPLLEGRGVLALIEPIGFATSSLRDKAELVEAIEAVGGPTRFKLVHDTFQHCIAGGGPIFPDHTAMVHISGISAPDVGLDAGQDGHRILVDAGDRCGTLAQIADFLGQGYDGPFSFECTAPGLLPPGREAEAIGQSFAFIEAALARL